MAICVTALSLTPIKGTRILPVDTIELGESGARGDRSFYIVDADGAMVNGKRLGALHTVVAQLDGEALSLRFPDGTSATAPVRPGAAVATTFFGQARPARVLDGPWSEALSSFTGQTLRVVQSGSAVDRGSEGAVSIVSRGSLRRLAEADPDPAEPEVDARRFRMLIEVDGIAPHEEDRWIGRVVQIGSARMRMEGHVGRCVTTTRGPETGEVDLPTLKMLATYRIDEETTEPLGFGVHGAVLRGGTVRVGDEVAVLDG